VRGIEVRQPVARIAIEVERNSFQVRQVHAIRVHAVRLRAKQRVVTRLGESNRETGSEGLTPDKAQP
jgi:hypothetical protein